MYFHLLLVTRQTHLLFWVEAFFILAFASKVWLSKTDSYRITLEFSAIFSILQVGKDRHLGIVLITDSICKSLALHVYNEYMQ